MRHIALLFAFLLPTYVAASLNTGCDKLFPGLIGPEENYFRRRIADAVGEEKKDEQRLIFADWLDEKIFDHDRADLIRVQVAVRNSAKRAVDAKVRTQLLEREEKLKALLLINPHAPRLKTGSAPNELRALADFLEANGDAERAAYIRRRIKGEWRTSGADFIALAPQGPREQIVWLQVELNTPLWARDRTTLERDLAWRKLAICRLPEAPKVNSQSSDKDLSEFANWLENYGDPDRAQLIRLELELKALPKDDPRHSVRAQEVARRRNAFETEIRRTLDTADFPRFITGWIFDVEDMDFTIRDGLVLQIRTPRALPALYEQLLLMFPEVNRITLTDLGFNVKEADKLRKHLAAQSIESRTFEVKEGGTIIPPPAARQSFFGGKRATIGFSVTSGTDVMFGISEISKEPLIFGVYNEKNNLIGRFIHVSNAFPPMPALLTKLPKGKYTVKLMD